MKYFLFFIFSLVACQHQQDLEFKLSHRSDSQDVMPIRLDKAMKTSALISYLDSLDCEGISLIGISPNQIKYEAADIINVANCPVHISCSKFMILPVYKCNGDDEYSVNLCDSYDTVYNQLKAYYLNPEKLYHFPSRPSKGVIGLIVNRANTLADIISMMKELRQIQSKIMSEQDLNIPLVIQIQTNENKYPIPPPPNPISKSKEI